MNIVKEAHARRDVHVTKGTCIHCKQVVINQDGSHNKGHFYSEAGQREYQISAICETCFDSLFKD